MSNFVILTDSACDLKPEYLKELGVGCLSLSFNFTDEDKTYGNYDLAPQDFYNEMRNGRAAKTSAATSPTFGMPSAQRSLSSPADFERSIASMRF